MPLIPEMLPLHRVAGELNKATHILVAASRRGEFVPLVRVGSQWYVRADEVREWFASDHEHGPSRAETRALKAAGAATP